MVIKASKTLQVYRVHTVEYVVIKASKTLLVYVFFSFLREIYTRYYEEIKLIFLKSELITYGLHTSKKLHLFD